MSRIYLAPSCQTWNVGKYPLFGVKHEAEMCNLITKYIVKELQKYYIDALFAGEISTGLAGNERRANELKCTSYYAIHTNAAGSTAHGVTALYQSWSGFTYARRAKSKLMATELCKGIATMGRANRGAVVGRKFEDGREYFGDLRVPNMPSTILEIEFHTNLEATNWIVKNPAAIGKNIAQSIARIEKLILKPQPYTGRLPVPVVSKTSGTKENVLLWQNFLCWYGTDVVRDGVFGNDTYAKTVTFQKENGLTPYGIVEELTIAKASTVKK